MKITLKTSVKEDSDNIKKNDKVKLNNIFGNDEDGNNEDDTSVGKHLLAKKRSTTPATEDKSALNKPTFDKKLDLSTDGLAPELYQYDEFVDDERVQNDKKSLQYLGFISDDVKHAKIDNKNIKINTKESQYMKKLISTAKYRQIDRDIALEKQLLKEDIESNNNEVSEAFITGAYKRKLEERKQYELEQQKQEEYDAVHSKSNVSRLHSYMLNAGIAKRSNVK